QAEVLVKAAGLAGIDVDAIDALVSGSALTDAELFSAVTAAADDVLFDSELADLSLIEELMALAERYEREAKYFLRPEALQIIERLQEFVSATPQVGKVNALTDVVKVLNRELRTGDDSDYRLPDSATAAAQLLIQFQSSHRPQDLWHLTTPDYKKTALWLQLRSGDNQEMTRVIENVDRYFDDNPLPAGVTARWAGKTYINVVWQQAMVSGMLKSLLGAFVFVFFMMLLLFRSVRLALLAMVPLSVTIVAIYGLIGWVGKDYDMPIAVLSSLTLGLSVDFAIHFLERFRSLLASRGSFAEAAREIFEEPGRAIARNAFVIALGFTPLFLAPLVPYVTVGAFMTSVMAISGLSTLVLLPAVIRTLGRRALPGPVATHSPAGGS
ncbi:MAG: MMPL family transporter, partial [Acidobacteriota bacterium]|nr:MMPL family transporter [Acidobacteriota bacterium]